MNCIISIKDLSFQYPNSSYYALYKINLDIYEKDFIILTGPSGCGKSTLIKLLNGLIPLSYQGKFEGKVIVNGKETKLLKVHELSREVGIVFQNPEEQLFTMSVEKEIAFGLENLRYERKKMFEIINEVLKLTNIEHLRFKSPFLLSGGEQQKVAIASILAIKPKVLALDEPLSNLDFFSSNLIVEFLNYLNKNYGLTIIIAEHRLDLLAKYANRIVILKEGKKVVDSPIKDALTNINLEEYGVNEPTIVKLRRLLKEKYNLNLNLNLKVEDFIEEVKRMINEH